MVPLIVCERLTDGVSEGELDVDGVADRLDVKVGLCVPVRVGVAACEGVEVRDAPIEVEGVRVELAVAVRVDDSDGVIVRLTDWVGDLLVDWDGEATCVLLEEREGVSDCEDDLLCVTVCVAERVPVEVAEGDRVSEAVGVCVSVARTLSV